MLHASRELSEAVCLASQAATCSTVSAETANMMCGKGTEGRAVNCRVL
jgi:hypothetical protein